MQFHQKKMRCAGPNSPNSPTVHSPNKADVGRNCNHMQTVTKKAAITGLWIPNTAKELSLSNCGVNIERMVRIGKSSLKVYI